MWYNEYHSIINSGINEDELVTFLLADYGVNFPEDGIYCLEQTLEEDPEVARSFIRSSIKGWNYAFSHGEETLDIVMEYVNRANLPTNRIHQKWMLDKMQKVIQPEGKGATIGELSRNDYNYVATKLLENDLINYIPKYRKFHEDEFTP